MQRGLPRLVSHSRRLRLAPRRGILREGTRVASASLAKGPTNVHSPTNNDRCVRDSFRTVRVYKKLIHKRSRSLLEGGHVEAHLRVAVFARPVAGALLRARGALDAPALVEAGHDLRRGRTRSVGPKRE